MKPLLSSLFIPMCRAFSFAGLLVVPLFWIGLTVLLGTVLCIIVGISEFRKAISREAPE